MKKYLNAFIGITITAMIATGCDTAYYAQSNNNDYYYDGYGDGQPNYYSQQYDNQRYQYQQPPFGFNDFYTQLSPYGSWVNMAPYGQVWIASVRNFQPYSTNGYWAYTSYGWTWVSNYTWGWAPFHYGRWGYNTRYGWYWVPGYVWGPAWVAWSSSADMYGWAPLMPGMDYGVNLSVNLFPSTYWTFMPGRYMGNNNIGNYYVNRSRNTTIINNTVIINNYGTENNRRYSTGPTVSDVQRHTNTTIQPIRVSNTQDSRTSGISNNELRIYRPVTSTETNRRLTPENDNNNNSREITTQPRRQDNQPVTQQGNNNNNSREITTQPRRQDNPVTQQGNNNNSRETTTQPRRQDNQPATQQTESRRIPVQPEVTPTATPQKAKQIRTAEKENSRTQQSPQTTTPSRTTTTPSRRQ